MPSFITEYNDASRYGNNMIGYRLYVTIKSNRRMFS